jgi:pyruvate-formate lyase-activating enzyme
MRRRTVPQHRPAARADGEITPGKPIKFNPRERPLETEAAFCFPISRIYLRKIPCGLRFALMMSSISSGLKCRLPRQTKVRLGPSGIHIFDRLSGLNLLVDELVPPEASWAAAPRQISIALTNVCDLACTYCFAPKTPAMLAFDSIVSWLSELDANGTIGVGFGGGEPTFYRKFVEPCSYAANETRLAVTFTTHGHHLNDKLIAGLKGNVHFIRISMDGVNATYERLRGRSFEALKQRMNAVKRIAPFGINYVVNSDTVHDLDAAAELAAVSGAAEILLLPEQPVNSSGGIDRNTTQALQNWVSQYAGKVRLAVSERGAEGLPTCNPLESEIGLRAYAHVAADGTLKCTSYEHEGVAIGSSGIMSALRQLQTIKTL